VITDIFAAREDNPEQLTGETIVRRMHHPNVSYQPTLAEATRYLQTQLQRGDVLITLGAGNGWQVGESLLKLLAEPT
ncbi:MAG TPA: hypothetical protein PK299_13580, partial [Anaerolineales bacterium]|nr:hypothetical protein [Anaerolineales bacterium]